MKSLAIIAACLSIFLVGKSQPEAALNLSLDQAIELGYKYHASVKNATIDIQLAEHKSREVLSSGLPQINGSGSINDYIMSPISLIPAEIFGGPAGTYQKVSFVPKYNVSGSITASQLLFNGSYFYGVKASLEYAKFVQLQKEKTMFDVARDITKAYLTVLSVQETQAILTETKNRIDKQLKDISEIYNQGLTEKLDVDRLKLAQSQLNQQQDQLKSSLVVLKSLLNLQMGYDVKKEVVLTSTLDELNKKFNYEAYTTTEFDPNKKLELQVIDKAMSLQLLNVKANQSAYYPSLAAFGTYQITGQNKEFKFKNYNFETALVGLQLSVPIFDGFNKDAKIKQAKLSLLQTENTKANVANALTMAYINANTNVTNAKNQLDLNKQTLGLAETVYTITKAKFDEGVGNSFELITADSDLKNAKIQQIVARYNLVNAVFELKTALGK